MPTPHTSVVARERGADAEPYGHGPDDGARRGDAMGGTMRKAVRGWLAASMVLASMLVVAGCGGERGATGSESGSSGEPRGPEVEEARSAVGEVTQSGPTIEAARATRQRVVQWNARTEEQIGRQRKIADDVRRIAPTIVAGDSFTEGPCYDGTLPRYETGPLPVPGPDIEQKVRGGQNDLDYIERRANEALAALDALPGDARRAAASETDEQAVRDTREIAAEEREGLREDYETLKVAATAAEPEYEALKDEIRQMRVDAGCQMG